MDFMDEVNKKITELLDVIENILIFINKNKLINQDNQEDFNIINDIWYKLYNEKIDVSLLELRPLKSSVSKILHTDKFDNENDEMLVQKANSLFKSFYDLYMDIFRIKRDCKQNNFPVYWKYSKEKTYNNSLNSENNNSQYNYENYSEQQERKIGDKEQKDIIIDELWNQPSKYEVSKNFNSQFNGFFHYLDISLMMNEEKYFKTKIALENDIKELNSDIVKKNEAIKLKELLIEKEYVIYNKNNTAENINNAFLLKQERLNDEIVNLEKQYDNLEIELKDKREICRNSLDVNIISTANERWAEYNKAKSILNDLSIYSSEFDNVTYPRVKIPGKLRVTYKEYKEYLAKIIKQYESLQSLDDVKMSVKKENFDRNPEVKKMINKKLDLKKKIERKKAEFEKNKSDEFIIKSKISADYQKEHNEAIKKLEKSKYYIEKKKMKLERDLILKEMTLVQLINLYQKEYEQFDNGKGPIK